MPECNLSVYRVDGSKDILVLNVQRGNNTPYYYVGDGMVVAFVRIGNEGIVATPQQLNELVMRGKNLTFDTMSTDYKITDLTFTALTSVVEVSTEVSTEVKLTSEKLNSLLAFCEIERSRREMQEFCGIKTDEYFRKSIVNPMLELELIQITIPDKPKSPNQKYIKN